MRNRRWQARSGGPGAAAPETPLRHFALARRRTSRLIRRRVELSANGMKMEPVLPFRLGPV
jgi:hypothetical protein